MELTKDQIEEINDKCPSDQGVFNEPSGIPFDVKGLVVYTRYETGGVRGNSCWERNHIHYEKEAPKNKFKVLDMVLDYLMPNVTYLQYKQIDELVHTNDERDDGDYYGNRSDYKVEYIILSELYELLKKFKEN